MCSHFCRQMTVAAPGSARDDGLVTLAVHLSDCHSRALRPISVHLIITKFPMLRYDPVLT